MVTTHRYALQVLMMRFLPERKNQYETSNVSMSARLTKLNTDVPHYLADRPILFQNRWKEEKALDLKYETTLLEKGNKKYYY